MAQEDPPDLSSLEDIESRHFAATPGTGGGGRDEPHPSWPAKDDRLAHLLNYAGPRRRGSRPPPPHDSGFRFAIGFGVGLIVSALFLLILFKIIRVPFDISDTIIVGLFFLLTVATILTCHPQYRFVGCGVFVAMGLGLLVFLGICAEGFRGLGH